MTIQVSDSASNRNEQIENAAKAIGKSDHKRKVFEAIHYHKKAVKTVSEIMERTNLTRVQVLKAGGELVRKKIGIDQNRVNGEVGYAKSDFLQQHRSEILGLAGNKKKLEKYPTKRNPRQVMIATIEVPVSTADVVQITVDDIGNFKKVDAVSATEHLPSNVSENAFKKGIQAILGEGGKFTDWGGEKNDLLSTRLRLGGKRKTVAFAFKGPGTKGSLTPGKMGKNGDQIQRMFQSTADVFILQYWREIEESVLDQMKALATAKSATSGQRVWFGMIDGYDSRRIYEAYSKHFASSPTKKKKAIRKRTKKKFVRRS